jgi:hypothetical protein
VDGRQRCRRQDRAGNLKPAKDKSTVALIMALGRALVAQEGPQPEYSLPDELIDTDQLDAFPAPERAAQPRPARLPAL